MRAAAANVSAKVSSICLSVSRITAFSSRKAVSRSVRRPSSSSTCATASAYSSCASGLTGPSCSRRRCSRSTRALSASACSCASGSRLLGARLCRQLQQIRHRLGLLRRLLRLVAQPLGGHLGAGHGLARAAQRRLDLRLLPGALAQLARHRLARLAVARELRLELFHPLLDRLAGAAQRLRQALRQRRQRHVGGVLRPQPLDPRQPLGQFPCHALGLTALGRQLALDLGLAHGQRPLLGRRPALLDQPLRPPPRLAPLGATALGLAQRRFGLPARRLGGADLLQHALRRRARGVLGLHGQLARRDQPVAFVAPRQHALLAALGQLAHLAPRREPHAPGARGGDAGEALREILQALDHPCIRQQPLGQRDDLRRAAHQLQQPLRSDHRGLTARVAGRNLAG